MRICRGLFVFFISLWVAVLLTCCDCKNSLREVEVLLEANPQGADSILSTMPVPKSHRDRALYAVLKTQADYKLGKPFTSDSLILTATDYYGSRRRNYHTALAWYSQGCIYSKMNNDNAAIYAYLKAKDLFPDTLVNYYALAERNLGTHYLNKKMWEQAIEQFNCCKVNADRLQDAGLLSFANLYLVFCSVESGIKVDADNLFSALINDMDFQEKYLKDSIIQVPMDFGTIPESIRLRVFSVDGKWQQDTISQGAFYSIKAKWFYWMDENDSAYTYFKKAFECSTNLTDRCLKADKLSEVSARLGKADEAVSWHKRYVELRDSMSLVEKSDSRDILDLQYLHREELTEERMQNRHTRFVIICISSLLLFIFMTSFVYSLFKNREKKRIITKQKELINLEQEIRKGSIAILESQVREQSQTNPQARTALLNLYAHRLQMGSEYFRKTNEYKSLLSAASGRILSAEEKAAVIAALEQSFGDTIVDMQTEYPGIDKEESLTLILSSLHFKNELIADLFGNVTAEAIRKRKYRFGKSNPDYYALFS